MPIKGSLIAATALVHGLTIVTRNRTDIDKAGVKIIDPLLTDERLRLPPLIANGPTSLRGSTSASHSNRC